MTGWQPIETAPRDGRDILTCIIGCTPDIVRWTVIDGNCRWARDPEDFMQDDHFFEYFWGSEYQPTH